MRVNCYAVLDAKLSDFHLAIFDIKDEGAIRQFADAVKEPNVKWSKHPEDYSLWYVGYFDTTKGLMCGELPVNLVNASAIVSLTNKGPDQLEMLSDNGKEKELVS